ncbi:MAG: hypothetical protein ACYCSF_13580 [Acidimicrobiales bacterium]
MAERQPEELDFHRRNAELSHGELWLRYFELGGMSSSFQLEAICYGALVADPHDHDVIAQALNERFVEMGGNHPVPYAGDGNDRESRDEPDKARET